MDDNTIDISKIPKFQFQVHNDELKNCIRELHFQAKTSDKKMDKMKKDIELRSVESDVADTLVLINSAIDIDAQLLRQIAKRAEPKHEENDMKRAGNKLGYKIGQVSDVLGYVVQKMRQLQKKIETNEGDTKTMVGERVNALQYQLDEYKKSNNKENRAMKETSQANLNSFEQKVRQLESKTLWQINDCKNKLNDRVNEQLVRDVIKEGEAKMMSKLQATVAKNHIDPAQIDSLQNKSIRMEKEFELKIVQITARFNELKDSIESSLATKKEVGQQRVDSEKKIGGLQVQLAEAMRSIKYLQTDSTEHKDDIRNAKEREEVSNKELKRVAKVVSNLKLSDDFMKLMENMDPHKLCEIDNSISTINERHLKLEKEVEAIKRMGQGLRQRTEIHALLAPTDKGPQIDKQEVQKLVAEGIAAHNIVKKIPQIEGQMFEFRAYGDTINQVNKRITKLHKELDISSLGYSIKAMEEYIKRELLVMNTKIGQIESRVEEDKRRRPISARRTSDSKLSSSVSVKKLLPVDCISCFQNTIGERTPERPSHRRH